MHGLGGVGAITEAPLQVTPQARGSQGSGCSQGGLDTVVREAESKLAGHTFPSVSSWYK